jgi:hypothetical protein
VALKGRRQEVEKVVVAPIEGPALGRAEAAAVPLVRRRRVRVLLAHLRGLPEEAPPRRAGAAQELWPHAVVHGLEEAPLPARRRHGAVRFVRVVQH